VHVRIKRDEKPLCGIQQKSYSLQLVV
jgi:hypothetical protein